MNKTLQDGEYRRQSVRVVTCLKPQFGSIPKWLQTTLYTGTNEAHVQIWDSNPIVTNIATVHVAVVYPDAQTEQYHEHCRPTACQPNAQRIPYL